VEEYILFTEEGAENLELKYAPGKTHTFRDENGSVQNRRLQEIEIEGKYYFFAHELEGKPTPLEIKNAIIRLNTKPIKK